MVRLKHNAISPRVILGPPHMVVCRKLLRAPSRSASVVRHRVRFVTRQLHISRGKIRIWQDAAMRRWVAIVIVLCALLMPRATSAQQAQSAPAPQAAQAKPAAPQESSATQGNPEVKVWVNTKSGVYHCPGTHWYGTTKSGEYMKQSEAQQKGFRPAYYRPCK